MNDFGDHEGVAIVTGGSGGLGAAVCRLLAERGSDVALTYCGNEAAARAVAGDVESAGRRAEVVQLDLLDAGAAAAFVDGVAERFGGVHTLVHASGPLVRQVYVGSVDPAAFRRTYAATLDAPDVHLLVVEVDGTVGGYLLGFEHPSFAANGPVAWVEEIAVDERLRRRNVGTRLMAEFENRARQRGCRLTALATRRADLFYAALGYERSAVYFRKLL